MDDVPSEDKNEAFTVPINAEEERSDKRIVARYASLKLNGRQSSQVSRRQEYNVPSNIDPSNGKRCEHLREQQPKKIPS